jgi:hypothetical protein
MHLEQASAGHRAPQTLAELRDIVNNSPPHPDSRHYDPEKHTESSGDYFERHGLPRNCDWDFASLPTFGGVEPNDTTCVWSWDETHLLVGECLPWSIVPRRDGDM